MSEDIERILIHHSSKQKRSFIRSLLYYGSFDHASFSEASSVDSLTKFMDEKPIDIIVLNADEEGAESICGLKAVRSETSKITIVAYSNCPENKEDLLLSTGAQDVIQFSDFSISGTSKAVTKAFQRQKLLNSFQFSKEALEIRFEHLEACLQTSRLNAHFISNLVVGMERMLLENQNSLALNFVEKISVLMRRAFENAESKFITIENELRFIKSYVDAKKLSLKKSFVFNICLDKTINENLLIPPMFLQPLVENAIKHGVGNRENGKIELHLKKEGEKIICRVLDNGLGLNKKNVENNCTDRRSSSINKSRIKLYKGRVSENYSLNMNDRSDTQGMVAEFIWPAMSD